MSHSFKNQTKEIKESDGTVRTVQFWFTKINKSHLIWESDRTGCVVLFCFVFIHYNELAHISYLLGIWLHRLKG